MATSSRRTVTSAINSLANDGIVRLTTQDYAQFEALVSDYFGRDDETSNDEISSEEECGKTTVSIYAFWHNLIISHRAQKAEAKTN